MISIHAAVIDLKRLDLLAGGNSSIHALDARAKVMVTLVFIITVVSFDRYECARLLPFYIFPAAMIALAGLPPIYLVRKIILISSLVLMVGIFNPLFDHTARFNIGEFSISGGWASFVSLALRSTLTIGAAFILVGTTGFTAVCQALERLGTPHLFTVQMLFLHRYILVLADEANRTARARQLRSYGNKGMGIASFGAMTGHLLLRTWQRAERIYAAMLARGFAGNFHVQRHAGFGAKECGFFLGWSLLFILLRAFDIPEAIILFTGKAP